MKIIIGIRKSAAKGARIDQFDMVKPGSGNENIIRNKILRHISEHPEGNWKDTNEPTYDFYINDNGRKSIKTSVDLVGETVGVIDDNIKVKFDKNDSGDILISRVDDGINEEQLPQESTVKQLERIRKISKGTDIGDRISDMNKEGANIHYIHNPIDKGIESIQSYWKNSKRNLKNTIKRFNQHK